MKRGGAELVAELCHARQEVGRQLLPWLAVYRMCKGCVAPERIAALQAAMSGHACPVYRCNQPTIHATGHNVVLLVPSVQRVYQVTSSGTSVWLQVQRGRATQVMQQMPCECHCRQLMTASPGLVCVPNTAQLLDSDGMLRMAKAPLVACSDPSTACMVLAHANVSDCLGPHQ